jgi:hypothetical protein
MTSRSLFAIGISLFALFRSREFGGEKTQFYDATGQDKPTQAGASSV